jgi:hypothetical protein
MANTIQIKRSSTATSVPTSGQLEVGELAVNLADKKLYSKNASGVVVELDGSGVALTGNQTVAGVKTFTSSPVVPNATTSDQAVNKGQLDTVASQAGITLSTAVTASGTAVNFTGIPSWVKRITVMFSGVSTNGTSPFLIQIGDAGGIESTGYVSSGKYFSGSSFSSTTSTAGFVVGNTTAASITYFGHFTLCLVSGNNWTVFGAVAEAGNAINMGVGGKTLSDTLTQLRITTVGGVNAFDAGIINIAYEG